MEFRLYTEGSGGQVQGGQVVTGEQNELIPTSAASLWLLCGKREEGGELQSRGALRATIAIQAGGGGGLTLVVARGWTGTDRSKAT